MMGDSADDSACQYIVFNFENFFFNGNAETKIFKVIITLTILFIFSFLVCSKLDRFTNM